VKKQTLTLALLFRPLTGKLGVDVHPSSVGSRAPRKLANGDGILPLGVCFPMTALALLPVERLSPFACPGGPNTPIFGLGGFLGRAGRVVQRLRLCLRLRHRDHLRG
jgi:hypothetical protein